MKGKKEYVYWNGTKQVPLEEHVFAFASKWTEAREKTAFLKPFQAHVDDTEIVLR